MGERAIQIGHDRNINELMRALKDKQVTVIDGEPMKVLQTFLRARQTTGRILCTQATEEFTRHLASRVARDMRVTLGDEVGYSLYYESKATDETVFNFFTEGMLLREIFYDNTLSRFNFVIIDVSDGRTLTSNMLLAIFKHYLSQGIDTPKLLILSDTPSVPTYLRFFHSTSVVICGKQQHVSLNLNRRYPEIETQSLANCFIIFKSIGINELMEVEYIDRPSETLTVNNLQLMYALSALDNRGAVSKIGMWLATFPMEPMMSKMIISSERYGCSNEIITIAAMLVSGPIFCRPKGDEGKADKLRLQFGLDQVGDHIELLKVYNMWADNNFSGSWCYENYLKHSSLEFARSIRDKLAWHLDCLGIVLNSRPSSFEKIMKCVISGYFCHCARMQTKGWYQIYKRGQSVQIHPSSSTCLAPLPHRYIVFHEFDKAHGDSVRIVSPVKAVWLEEVASHYIKLDEADRFGFMPRGRGKACSK